MINKNPRKSSSKNFVNWAEEAKNVERKLRDGSISFAKAKGLLDRIKFHMRLLDVLQWGKHYFPEKFGSPFCHDLHDYLVSIRESTRTNTLAPRGYAKTTIKCFLIPIYQAVNEPNKFTHYLNIQATSTKSVAVNLTIREEIENNELLRQDYGDLVGNEKWTEKQFVLANGVVFTAIGSGDSVRGINYRNIRPDYIICDDLYDEDDIYSVDRVRKKNRWFWSSIYKALAKKETACIHLQGTAIHREDLMHTLPKEMWKTRKFQAIVDDDKKQVLWPEVETYDKLMEDKGQMGSIIFSREMMNELHDDENAIIKSHYIVYYDKLPDKVNGYWWSWDTAIEEGDQNDYTVGTLWADCADGYYLVDLYRKKVEFPALERDIKQCFEMVNAREVLVERKASGHQIVQVFKRQTKIPIIQMNPGKEMGRKKSERLVLVSGLFEAHKVKFPSNKSYMPDVVDELVNFPNASHDDIVDSITMFLERRLNSKDELWVEFI